MRRLWPDVRNVFAMQSRRRDKRSTTLPVVVQRDSDQKHPDDEVTALRQFKGYVAFELPAKSGRWSLDYFEAFSPGGGLIIFFGRPTQKRRILLIFL